MDHSFIQTLPTVRAPGEDGEISLSTAIFVGAAHQPTGRIRKFYLSSKKPKFITQYFRLKYHHLFQGIHRVFFIERR